MNLLGLTSVLILIISLFYLEIKWGPDFSKTFSRLVARKRSSIIFYFITFTIFLSLFSIFITEIFIPKLQLPNTFLWIFAIGVVAQFICVVIPETGGIRTKVHLAAASVMSVSAFVQVIILPIYTQLSLLGVIICSLSLTVMLAIWLIVLTKHRLIKSELALQVIYFVCYLGTLLLAFLTKV